jgi:hypothetical protein
VEFDIYGNLQPAEIILTDWVTFEKMFVESFPGSATRSDLFNNFADYVTNAKQIFGTSFYQWIDGSFITNKLNPRDIDFVTFVNFDVYYANESEIDRLRELRNIGKFGMDGYFVPIYPDQHPKRFLYEADQLQWQYLFQRSRSDRKKGIIELKY